MGGRLAAGWPSSGPIAYAAGADPVNVGRVNMASSGASDWRSDYRRSFPHADPMPMWITAARCRPPLAVREDRRADIADWGGCRCDKPSPSDVISSSAYETADVVAGGDHDVPDATPSRWPSLSAKHSRWIVRPARFS